MREASLLREVVIGLPGVGWIAPGLGILQEVGQVAVQGAIVLKTTFFRLREGFREDEDVLRKLRVGHVPSKHLPCRGKIFLGLTVIGDLLVQWLDVRLLG